MQFLGVWPKACKLAGMVKQTVGYNFSIKGKKKKKFHLVKPGAQLSIIYGIQLFHSVSQRQNLLLLLNVKVTKIRKIKSQRVQKIGLQCTRMNLNFGG